MRACWGRSSRARSGMSRSWEVQEGSYRYGDAEGVESAADRRIAPVITIKDGAIWRPDMASDE